MPAHSFPRKKLLGALRSALAAKLADGKITVVENFDLGEVKTSAFRKSLTECLGFLVDLRKIGGILDVGLRRRIDVDVGRHFHRDMSDVAMLGGACATVEGHAAASTAQTVSTADDDDLAALPLQHLRQDRARQPMQRVEEPLHRILHIHVALLRAGAYL